MSYKSIQMEIMVNFNLQPAKHYERLKSDNMAETSQPFSNGIRNVDPFSAER